METFTGIESTSTLIVAEVLQYPKVADTEYRAVAEVFALSITGFCNVDVKPTGDDVQL